MKTADQIIDKTMKLINPSSEPIRCTDTSNAEKIVELFGDRVRFDHRRKRWLLWKSPRWCPDDSGEINRFAVLAVKQLYSDAKDIEDLSKRTAVAKWAIQSESKMRLDASTGIAKNLLPIADNGQEWDQHKNLLACENGIIDLNDGSFREGKQEDRITMSTHISYDPAATCPRWEQFIGEIFEGNEELIRFVHKALGYTLTGDTSEQVVFFCYGIGSNGKSVLFSTLRNVLGDYSHDAPFHTFQRNQTTTSNDLASLEFKRMVVSSEVLGGRKIDESRLKNISGGDAITARYLYAEGFTFEPHCKIWLFVNHKPLVSDDSLGFWRRVRLIPFTRIFTTAQQDLKLTQKLQTEQSGILNWLIQGCLLWQQEGLQPIPQCVLEATSEYQQESDTLADFINEKCELLPTVETKASDLWKAYQAWAIEQGYDKKESLGSKTFYQKIGERYKRLEGKKGNFYRGISLSGGGSSTNFEATVEVQGSFPQTTSRDFSHREFSKTGLEAPPRAYEVPPTSTNDKKSEQDEFLDNLEVIE
ncbi:MAG: phage/plasmid primase, P4 family [Candidatus Gottesmanbacteria bacterium]|nr:phage/plasmid primase, P4 family [Candidatus Gottesmanbacteria bacterium]